MGKKSVPGTPQLDALGQPVVPMAFGPSLRALLEDVVELLTRELLKILLQERLLDENQGKYDLTDQVNIGWHGGRCGGDGGACTAAGGLFSACALSRIISNQTGACPDVWRAEQGMRQSPAQGLLRSIWILH